MAGGKSFIPDPFMDQPPENPLHNNLWLSPAALIALGRAPRVAQRPDRPPRVRDIRRAPQAPAIDLSEAVPGDAFITNSATIRIGPDGKPAVSLGKGHENGRAAAQVGPVFIPPTPTGVNVDANIAEARRHWPPWFVAQVPRGGQWDYKKIRGPEYEAFGNFNFGAAGAGRLPHQVLLRGAGLAQLLDGHTKPEYGGFITGTRSYGDDPVDQFWIEQGVRYNQSKSKALP